MSSNNQLHVRNPPETTSRLLEAAAAEFVRHGYDRARVSDIARNAGYTVGSIYARWSNKSDLMVAALDHILEQILPEQRLKDLNIANLPLSELLLMWGADQLDPDSPREVFAQAFGSARNNPTCKCACGSSSTSRSARHRVWLSTPKPRVKLMPSSTPRPSCCSYRPWESAST